MPATRRERALRTAVLLVVGAFALSLFETTSARSNIAASASPDPKLAGMDVHMHGDTPHYHHARDVAGADGRTLTPSP